jgi:hypothetical protein
MSAILLGNEKVAVTIKSKGDVKFKREEEKEFQKKLDVGQALENKDEVAVGKKSFASIIFLEDKSMLNIHENTNFIVHRDRKNSKIIRRISLEYGRLRANVQKSANKEFIISTPTSVAAVKGTIFWVISDETEGDTFYGVEGSVEITNLISNKKVLLSQNEKGVSNSDGDLEKYKVTQEEMPKDDDETGTSKVIRIPYENDQGEIKHLEIHYKE